MGLDMKIWTKVVEEINNVKARVGDSIPILLNASAEARGRLNNLTEKKVNVSFDDLDEEVIKSSEGSHKAIDWMGGMISKLRERTEESRIYIKEIFTLLKDFADNINEVRDMAADNRQVVVEVQAEKAKLEKENDKRFKELEKELDEARQRGLKGNIIVSSPALSGKPAISKSTTVDPVGVESSLDFCLRLVKLKTGVTAPRADVGACHALRAKTGTQPSYILTFVNRKEDSAWDRVTSCMYAGKSGREGESMKKDINVFLNVQLTKTRADLAKIIRKARFDERKVESQ